MTTLVEQLADGIPQSAAATILHNDYKLDNTMVSGSGDIENGPEPGGLRRIERRRGRSGMIVRNRCASGDDEQKAHRQPAKQPGGSGQIAADPPNHTG